MIKIALLLPSLLLGFSLLTALAKPADTLAKALNDKELTDDEGKELVELVFHRPKELLETLENDLPADLLEKGKSLAVELRKKPAEDHGENRLGAGVGWFTEFVDDQLSAYPILSSVKKGSPAEKAKLRQGDVIAKAETVLLHRVDARNRFIILLKIWPSATPMKLDIRRNNYVQELENGCTRPDKAKASVTLKKG